MASIQYAKISVEDDDEITRDVVKSPWNSKGILGRMTWSWFSSVIDTGKDRPLQLEDLPQLAVQDTAEEIIDIPGLFAAVQSPYIAAAVFAFIYYSLQIGSAIVVRLLILELIEPTNEWIGYTFACALGISALLQAILLHQFFFLTNRAGTRARTLLSTALFKKLLLVKQGLVGSSAINLISNDTYKIEVALGFLLFLVAAPLLGIAVASLLYLNLGVSGLVGVGCMFLNVPLQIYFSKKITAFRKNTSKFTDSRTQSIKEFLKGIQVIKMYNW
jgi:ABC-type multidrug transport system fused ATPase/permease subunit